MKFNSGSSRRGGGVVGSLGKIRAQTRGDVEGALSGLKAKRADLVAKLREVEDEIALAGRWLGKTDSPTPAKPLTLQEAMAVVLRENGNEGMRPQRLADIINERKLYTKRDEGPVGANGIQARVSNYGSMFIRENGLVRLREPVEPENSIGFPE